MYIRILVLTLFTLQSIPAYSEAPKGEEKMYKCLAAYNSTSEQLSKFSTEQMYDFTYGLLESMNAKEQAKALKERRSEFISNPDNAKSYTLMLLTQWTESCVESASKDQGK
jgi:hypothetical protein